LESRQPVPEGFRFCVRPAKHPKAAHICIIK